MGGSCGCVSTEHGSMAVNENERLNQCECESLRMVLMAGDGNKQGWKQHAVVGA